MIETINGKAYLKVGDKVYELGGGSGGTGTVSWNDLKEKPFGDESVTIEWDGDSTGKVTVGEGMLVKVSDLTPEPSELVGSVLTVDGTSTTIPADMIMDGREQGMAVVVVGDEFVIVYEDNAVLGEATFAEKGFYAVSPEIKAFSLSYGSIKKLDPKFLPEGGVGYEGVTDIGDTLTFDGTKTDIVIEAGEFQLCYVSDSVPTESDLRSGTFVAEGVSMEITADKTEEHVFQVYAFYVVDVDNCTLGHVTFPKKGIYAMFSEDAVYPYSLHIPNYNFTKTEVRKIDPKYLPNAVFGTSGKVTITAANWTDGAYTLTVDDLGEKDAIFFTPSTKVDKIALEDASVFIGTEGQTVTFEADATPTADITLDYFIVRGA